MTSKSDLIAQIYNMIGCNPDIENPPSGERWVVRIDGGGVVMTELVPEDGLVISCADLPAVAANRELVSDQLAEEVVLAIEGR